MEKMETTIKHKQGRKKTRETEVVDIIDDDIYTKYHFYICKKCKHITISDLKIDSELHNINKILPECCPHQQVRWVVRALPNIKRLRLKK